MGYRSDVAIACDRPAFYELIKRLKGNRVSLDYFDVTKPCENLWLISIESVKWYRYAGIQQVIEDWVGDCIASDEEEHDNFFHGGIHFIRVGDDQDDIEDRYEGDWIDDGMYIERFISKPLDGDLVTVMCPWGYEE